MKSTVVVFPFDLFGSPGTGAGAQLLGDAVREIVADTARETRPSRADCLRGNLRVKEVSFDTVAEIANWSKRGRQLARQALKSGDFVVWLGGNHLSALPLLEELGTGDAKGTLVVQFDAHLDLYSFHDNTPELSHGNFLKRAAGPLPQLINVGHRDLFLTDDEIRDTFTAVYPAVELAGKIDRAVEAIRAAALAADRVWIDIDCDAFDPAYLPGVQQPLPFGITPTGFLSLFEAAWSGKVVGVSISEFDPGRDARDASLDLLVWLIEFILLRRHGEG